MSTIRTPVITPREAMPIFSLPFNFTDQDSTAEHRELSEGVRPEQSSSDGNQSGGKDCGRSATNTKADMGASGGTDLTILTDNSSWRLQMMGSSSSLYILVQWLDLFFAQREQWRPLFPHFRLGMAYGVEMLLPFSVSLPRFPSAENWQTYISIFFSRIQPMFPVLDHDAFQESVNDLARKMESGPTTLSPTDYPALACAYAVFSAGADEKEGKITETGTLYLEATYFLHAHLAAIPYVNSVQVLLLLTIILRGRNKDGASWGTLGMAIRIAQSIGLHQHISNPATHDNTSYIDGSPDFIKQADLRSRIWWSAYCLERIMELETGRPSAIQDSECDQILPSPTTHFSDYDTSFDYFRALIDLAKIQTQISELLYRKKSVKRKTEQLLNDTGMLDRELLNWAEMLPDEIRPGHDIFYSGDQLHLATFLSLSFHQTTIALHRPALMSGSQWLRGRVDHFCMGTSWRHRLRHSMCICAASARAIVKATSDLVHQSRQSQLVTVTQIVLASVVLGIYISKTSRCWMNDSDLALLVNSSQYAEEQYLQMGQDPEFARGCSVLRIQMNEHVQGLKGVSEVSESLALKSPGPAFVSQVDTESHSLENQYGDDLFSGANLDDLWPCLWGDDLSQVYSSGAESDVLNTYLLGLPQFV